MELKTLRSLGLENREILLAMTRYAAQNLFNRNDIGTIEKGKVADLVILDGDPLKDIEALKHVDMVIQSGHVVVDRSH
jgi:imidazolonepropionase-like amidohydrolase